MSGGVRRAIEHSQRDATFSQAFARSIAAQHQRLRVAGIHVRDVARQRLIDGVEQRDEARAGCVAAHLRVQARHEVRGLELLVHQRSEHCQQQCHQQRGRAALADHIAHRHDQPSIVDHWKAAQLPVNHTAGGRPEGLTRASDLHRRSHQICRGERVGLVGLECFLQLELLPYEDSWIPWILPPSLRLLGKQIRLRDDAEQAALLVDDRQGTEVLAHHPLGNRLGLLDGRREGTQVPAAVVPW